jgi:hypothetical protein
MFREWRWPHWGRSAPQAAAEPINSIASQVTWIPPAQRRLSIMGFLNAFSDLFMAGDRSERSFRY